MSFLGDLIDNVGTGLGIPELGWSEKISGGATSNTGSKPYILADTQGRQTLSNGQVVTDPNYTAFQNALSSKSGLQSPSNNTYNPYFDPSTFAQPSAQGSGSIGGSGVDISYLDDQAQQLRDLLARTDTGLNQGLQQNQDEYDRQLGGANASKDQQYANYEDQRVAQNQGKLNTYDAINKGANNGYRSLAQIIGRAAGTGSSAFRDLLPNVIGSDTSTKRNAANQTYGSNLAGIDKSQGQYDISFGDVLDDLLRQKKSNESTLRTGIEGQRQTLNGQLATNAGQKAQALGGGYAQVKAAQQPFQSSIDDSRNQVENFFNQFRTAYTPKQAVATAPELANYTADRSVINAQNQGAIDPTNPYAALLRKKQQGAA